MLSIKRIMRKYLNRLRGVPLVLAAMSLGACAEAPEPEPPLAQCLPSVTAQQACDGGYGVRPGSHTGLSCEQPAYPEDEGCFAAGTAAPGTWCCPKPALVCEEIGLSVCASSGCFAKLSCNRNPSQEMGIKCALDGGVYFCQW